MRIAIKNNKISVLIVGILFIVTACDSNRVFDKYVSLEQNTWSQETSINFDFQITDTISKNNLFINIRNNDEYQYSNLYLITNLIFPDGKKIVDTLQYEMADKNGKFLGSGVSEIKESKLFLKENRVFPASGNYQISISQAMRKNGNVDGIKLLKGITDVGFRIEKVE